jgi:isocitrate dehydrogenase
LGQSPDKLESVTYPDELQLNLKYKKSESYKPAKKELVGVDIFIQENNRNPNILAEKLMVVIKDLPLELIMVTNRGVKVWPHGISETFCTDHWRCRFMTKRGGISNHAVLWMLQREFSQSDLEVIKTENLYLFDGEIGYSLGQGQ